MHRSGDPAARVAALERGATVLRHLGLGRAVDAVARRFGSRLGHFEAELNGLRLGGDRVGHLYYARELMAEDREAHFRDLFVDAIHPGATVLEGGPYIGYLTLHAARAAGAQGRVIAVEPNPETVGTLRANVVLNHFEGRIEIVEAALGAERGRARFHVTAGGDTSSLHPPRQPTSVVEVEVLPGDDLVEEGDVVKLDLEGNEVAALRGLEKMIVRSRPVIFCECNPEMLHEAGSTVAELRRRLEQMGYGVRWIDEEAKTLRSLDERWSGGYVNLFCEPR